MRNIPSEVKKMIAEVDPWLVFDLASGAFVLKADAPREIVQKYDYVANVL